MGLHFPLSPRKSWAISGTPWHRRIHWNKEQGRSLLCCQTEDTKALLVHKSCEQCWPIKPTESSSSTSNTALLVVKRPPHEQKCRAMLWEEQAHISPFMSTSTELDLTSNLTSNIDICYKQITCSFSITASKRGWTTLLWLFAYMQICMNGSNSMISALVRENSICSNDLIYWDVQQMKILSHHP